MHAANVHGKRRQWICQNWTQKQWEQVIISDKWSFTIFQMTENVFVWQSSSEAFHIFSLVSNVKQGGGSDILWGAISWRDLGTLLVLREKVIGEHYRRVLSDHLHLALWFLVNVANCKMTMPLFTRLTVVKNGQIVYCRSGPFHL